MTEPGAATAFNDALLVVDVQRDFCSGGALPVPDADAVIAPLNKWLDAARDRGALVIFSRDWHPRSHPSFKSEGGPWPQHCLQDSSGARFHEALRVPPDAFLVSKGVRFDCDQYSAFDETGLAALLKKRGIERVWIGGLALDICVRASALDAARAGFETHVIPGACRALSREGEAETLAAFREAGVGTEPTVTFAT
jgi:nicotinamidase/pyrazinamidase